ncbi:MAG: cob(I)yrinic acid a,c-diamide adenosyltransferase [Candidatus Omnitrophica bacterium]|nr:cob(I)yrinic acid a,c-diamide adenosyltransferase [Candidatus Omnitrophota bacterium]
MFEPADITHKIYPMIQIYTGNGKGKTTACLGLAIRAAGAGFKVFFCQFVKNTPCGELIALKKIKNITLEQFGSGCFIKKKIKPCDMKAAESGLRRAREVIIRGCYRMVILDEIHVAVRLGLLDVEEVISLIESTPPGIELVLSGRHAHPRILRKADLISDIREVRHYYRKGVKARRGIEF